MYLESSCHYFPPSIPAFSSFFFFLHLCKSVKKKKKFNILGSFTGCRRLTSQRVAAALLRLQTRYFPLQLLLIQSVQLVTQLEETHCIYRPVPSASGYYETRQLSFISTNHSCLHAESLEAKQELQETGGNEFRPDHQLLHRQLRETQ